MAKYKNILLFTILLLAAVLRLYRLADYPTLNADEAAIGYNAYSLLETGKDEHGNPWPVHFQSFNDYKPGLYVYAVLPFVKFFGLNELAVRIPSALFGVATVWLIYLLVLQLFRKTQNNSLNSYTQTHAIIAAAMMAISPWHIHFSRGGWEVNVATFFVILGVYLFVKGLNSLPFLMISFLSFALSLYTYHAARIIVPLIGLGLLFFYRNEIKLTYKNLLLAGLVGLVALLPLIKDLSTGGLISRAAGVGLTADQGPVARINEQRGEHDNLSGNTAKLLHNKAVNYTLAFLENWGDHFHGEFLFLSGDDIQRNKVPETGQIYLIEFLFVLIAIIGIVKAPKRWGIIIFWLFVAPTAAALTFQSPHALRSHNMIVPLTIISAYGVTNIIKAIQSIKQPYYIRTILLMSLGIVVFWSLSRYLHMYYNHMSKEYPFSSQYGVPELVSYVAENSDKYENVVVTERYDQPYILFLFYLKYPPEKFQNDHTLTARDKFGFSTVRHYDKYHFEYLSFEDLKSMYPRSLIAVTEEQILNEGNIIGEIYGSNGYKYFVLVAN